PQGIHWDSRGGPMQMRPGSLPQAPMSQPQPASTQDLRARRTSLCLAWMLVLTLLLPWARAAGPEGDSTAFSSAVVEQRREHLARLGADRWHAGGYRGDGVKVAILDSGFRGYRTQLGRS